MQSKKDINYTIFTKTIVTLFLLSVFSYVFYFSLTNIINYWTFTEIHINYSLGFSKRGLLGSLMLYLENIGVPKNIFFSSIFYLITLCNIFLFLNLLNRFVKNHLLFYIFFALNPALLLFSFYDLGGYARGESFGISVCLLHVLFAQKLYSQKINYQRYLKISLLFIFPLSLLTILIHDLNILFLSFHFFTALLIVYQNQFKNIKEFQYLIVLNFVLTIFILYLLISHPFTKEFAQELYSALPTKSGTSFWIWDAISNSFFDRIDIEIKRMQNPKGAIILYFFIFLFYFFPIFFLLRKTTEKIKFQLLLISLSITPFLILFFIGQDWGRWFHIILIVLFACFIQFKEKEMIVPKNYRYKILTYLFIVFFLFQFSFTRIPHCCNLIKLNLNLFGGIVPKIQVFYKIFNNKYDIKKRFQTY
tara:strand:+ start:2370 stop:3626 length:1257 start_codon:yes stop_codon:yes gene_type:complete